MYFILCYIRGSRLDNFAPQGTFDNVWRHFWFHYWHLVSRSRDAAKHATVHKTTSTTKNYLAPNVDNVTAEKPYFILKTFVPYNRCFGNIEKRRSLSIELSRFHGRVSVELSLQTLIITNIFIGMLCARNLIYSLP